MKTPLLALLALLSVSAAPAAAHERGESVAQRVHRNDGDSNFPFAINCTDSGWTVVGSSVTRTDLTATGAVTAPTRLRRRAMTVQTLATVSYAVCLSSTSTEGSCSDTTTGYELGASWGSVSIYDEAAWYCRTRSGGNTRIKGAEHYDSRDERAP